MVLIIAVAQTTEVYFSVPASGAGALILVNSGDDADVAGRRPRTTTAEPHAVVSQRKTARTSSSVA
jgi:hypothetical protein